MQKNCFCFLPIKKPKCDNITCTSLIWFFNICYKCIERCGLCLSCINSIFFLLNIYQGDPYIFIPYKETMASSKYIQFVRRSLTSWTPSSFKNCLTLSRLTCHLPRWLCIALSNVRSWFPAMTTLYLCGSLPRKKTHLDQTLKEILKGSKFTWYTWLYITSSWGWE